MFNRKTTRSDVISVRLNDERLALLERYQAVLTQRLGKPVSIAEAAFLMMEERAPDVDRETTRYELLQAPTASLDHIRKRWASKRTLSAGEWDLVADYVQIGAEEERQEPPMVQPAVPSRASYLALLDAFEAVYQQRAVPHSRHAWAYFSNLDGYSTGAQLSDRREDGDQRHEALMRVLAERRRRLSAENESWAYPGNIGRCFLLAVRDEGVPAARLDQVLAPYWSVLWGLAARGHWIRHDHQPVRVTGPADDDVRRRFLLPDPFTADNLHLSFGSAGLELAATVTLGRDERFHIFVTGYPALVEFKAMLDAPADRSWHGVHFSAPLSKQDESQARTLSVARFGGVRLSAGEWTALRALFRDAWASPDVQRWLHELAQEYGEQG